MTISLRRLVRSHCLRTMAVLAWLMLVSTSLLAAPMPMGAEGAWQARQTTGSHQPHGMTSMQQGPTQDSDMPCCNEHLTQGCSCHSLCGNVLSPVALRAPAPVMLAASYARLFHRRTPAPDTVPPLRPPLV